MHVCLDCNIAVAMIIKIVVLYNIIIIVVILLYSDIHDIILYYCLLGKNSHVNVDTYLIVEGA